MVLLSVRDIQNKAGFDFNSGSTTFIFAEDILQFKGALENPHEVGSEVFVQLYNVTTAERDALSMPGNPGFLIFNTSVGSLQFYDGGSWNTVGEITSYSDDISAINGSFSGSVEATSFSGSLESAPFTETVEFAGSALGGKNINEQNGSFTHTSTIPDYTMVFVEGLLRQTNEYSISSDTITFSMTVFDDDEVTLRI